MKSRLVSIALAIGVAAAWAVVRPSSASAQDLTTGAISGVITDKLTGELAMGVTVVVTSPRTRAETTFTEEDGTYRFTNLTPGDGYVLTFYYGDLMVERRGIRVSANRTASINMALSPEVIVVVGDAPDVDRHSTARGLRFGRGQLTKLPNPGTSFDEAIGATPGSVNDGFGFASSGSTSLENQWVVDGVSTTGLTYGTSGMPVLNDFIEEIEVITGGYNAEYGRATGAVVNAVTRSGSNELAGSVFAYVKPGFLTADRERAPSQATSIDPQADNALELDMGFELGGPIVKDRAWFWVGVAPQIAQTHITRITQRRSDCRITMEDGTLSTPAGVPCPANIPDGYQDGAADIDPTTGFYIYEELDRRTYKTENTQLSAMGKINVAISAAHQGQVTLSMQPGTAKGARMLGIVDQQRLVTTNLISSASAKWTSKFNDDKTEVEAVLSGFRSANTFGSPDGTQDDDRLQLLYMGSLGNWARMGGESQRTLDGCRDNTGGDPYALINNCPDEGAGYAIGGPGGLSDDYERRLSAKVGIVHRLRAKGTHEIKAGADIEQGSLLHLRAYSGGALIQNYLNEQIEHWKWVELAPGGADPSRYPDLCGESDNTVGGSTELMCDYLDRHDDAAWVGGETVNWSAYLRDSWQIQPHFTVNLGLRYEEQRLRYADHLRDTIDGQTGQRRGTNAMILDGMWSPRIGVLYDWTKQARSKVYGHWGRFYESVPMDINERAFGGETTLRQTYTPVQCGPSVEVLGGQDGEACEGDPSDETMLGGATLIAPDLKAQYMDELVLGAEYELIEDLKLGISVQHRRLGRVIEDVSVDGADTYVIANPGEWSDDAEAELVAQINAMEEGSDARRDLERMLGQYQAIRTFDKPRRDYDAIELTASRRFSKGLFMQASYTWSKTAGNYPGLLSYDNGQVDPNISSQYDLVELLANREGPLPQDRPHYVKLDSYYTFDLKKAGNATVGVRVRALSGTPVDTLGRHELYGVSESFLLPRGSRERTAFETSLDLHADYARPLGKGVTLELFADVFNVANDQGTFSVDEDYTYLSSVNPIVGGTYEDVIWAKEIDDDGNPTANTIIRNPNFGNTAARYAPLSARLGARITF